MKTLTSLALALFATSLVAQPKPVEVKVQQVNDRRTSGSFSHLTINVELPKILSSEVAASRVLLAAATDNTGDSLLDSEASEPQLEANMRGMMGGPTQTPPPPMSISITLKNPDRKATSVQEIRGEIELYMPAKDPNSIAEIPKFMSSSGKPLTHKALKANGIEIALLSSAQLDAERKRLGDAKRKEYKESGWEDGEDLESMVKSYLESALTVEDSDILARIKDPDHRLQEITYIDAAGETKLVSTRTEEGITRLSTWGGKPQADWKLKVSMKTAKNMVRYSFGLKDVALP